MRKAIGLSFVALFSSLLTGCTIATTATPSPTAGVALRGMVHGGQQAVSGAHVYLMAATVSGAGSAGYGLASTSLLTGTGYSDSVGGYVLTAADGSFALDKVSGTSTTYDYTCPASNPEVYLYGLGGNPGAGGVNAGAGFLAALGPCNSLSASTYTYMNEVTTVAAAYALAGFATDATHVSIPQNQPGATGSTGVTGPTGATGAKGGIVIARGADSEGSSGTPAATGATGSTGATDTLAQTGLTNAFLNASQLVNSQTGTANTTTPATGSTGFPDYAQINTLANILASCINTNGAVTGPTNATNCYTLFNNALSGGATGTVPTDTATAAINIAHHPYVSAAVMTNLYGLQAATAAPFVGKSTEPTDFIVGIRYSGGGLNFPYGISIDAEGSAWVVDLGGNNVTKFSSTGVPAPGTPFAGAGMSTPYQMAIDISGNAWVGSLGQASLNKIPNSGSGGSLVTGGQTANTRTVSIDALGDVWGGNESVFVVNSGGTTGATYTAGVDTTSPIGATAIDAAGNIWAVGEQTTFSVLRTSTGAAYSGSPYTYKNGLSGGFGVAIDSSGNAWIASGNFDSNKTAGILKVAGPGGTQTEINGGGLDEPSGIAVDGAGNVWVADDYVAEFNNAGTALSPSTEFVGGSNSNPQYVAIDGSGDVWLTNRSANTVSVLIGAATPVVTPIVQGLVSPYTPGSRP